MHTDVVVPEFLLRVARRHSERGRDAANQQCFISALERVCIERDEELRLPRNPIKDLLGAAYTEWLTVREAARAKLGRYGRPDHTVAKAAGRTVIESWAARNGLSDASAATKVPDWITAWAEAQLFSKFRTSRGVGDAPRQPDAERHPAATQAYEASEGEANIPAPEPMERPAFTQPERKPGEKLRAYRSRSVKEYKAWRRAFTARHATTRPLTRRSLRGIQRQPLYYEFLALRICRLKWAEIHARYPGAYADDNGIIMGARKVAEQIGLVCPSEIAGELPPEPDASA